MKSEKSRIILIAAIIVIGLVSMHGCKKNDDIYSLRTNTTKLRIDYDENLVAFSFTNISDKAITWTASTEDDFLVIDNNSGSLAVAGTASLEIAIRREFLTKDSIQGEFQVTSSRGDQLKIGVYISNYPEEKLRLEYDIVDAAYSENYNKLYLLPYSNSQSHFIEIFDVSGKTFERIDLPENTNFNRVTISYDESRLAIYGNETLLTMDLATLQLSDQVYLEGGIGSLVFVPDNKLYIFIDYYYSGFDMVSYDLNTNIKTNYEIADFYSDISDVKLHPSGKYIYGVENSYSDFVKLSITDAEPLLIYDKSLSDFNTNLWISDGGTQIFSNSNKYLTIDPEAVGDDVVSISEFVFNYQYIHDFNQNTPKQEYYIIPKQDSYNYTDAVLVYDENLNYKSKYVAEPFMVRKSNTMNTTTGYDYVKALTYRVFSTKDGTKLIVIVKSENQNYYGNIYAIQIINR
jgi:hypothetical protein